MSHHPPELPQAPSPDSPFERFVRRVVDLGGLSRNEQADRVIEATLDTLGERLLPEEIDLVAAHLPGRLADRLEPGHYGGAFDRAELFERIARRAGVSQSEAIEHTEVVCRVVAEALSPEARSRLASHLPPPLAALFEIPPAPEPAEPRRTSSRPPSAPPPKKTLASGRAGSEHPLSESKPERAHTNSVARSPDPHGDTKLSSAHGTTQERLDETLATGEPPRPRRTLADS